MSSKGTTPAANGKKKKAHTGKCTIYDQIDSLTDCASLPENKKFPTFVAAVQDILNQLAYYAVSSDGAVLEERERWHSTFTDRLYEEAGQARREAIAARAVSTGAAPGGPSAHASAGDTSDRVLPAAVPARKAPADLPASLRAIFEGSHSSFREDDDE